MADPVSLTPEVEFSRAPTDASSNSASLSDTPPTTVADSVSLASDHSKSEQTPLLELDHAVHVQQHDEHRAEPADPPTHHEDEPRQESLHDHDEDAAEAAEGPSSTRPRRARASLPVYNLSKLAGTDVHGKRRSKGDVVSDRRRRTISGDTLVNQTSAAGETRDSVESSIEATGSGSPARKKIKKDSLVEDSINALDMDWSVRRLNTPRGSKSPRKKGQSASPAPRQIATRRSGTSAETLATKLSSLGKRGRKTFEKGITRMSRELRRLQDTNEFAHIDTKPVRHTVWSNGKYVDPNAPAEEEPPRKRVKTEEPAPVEATPAKTTLPGQRRVKTWLNKGLYAGQDLPADMTKSLTIAEKKAIAQIPELAKPAPPNKSLPFPVYNGMRTLITGRDFKLPYDVCNPLPPGQPKPDEWRKMTRNRFIGDAKQIWIQNSDFKEYQSKCVCKPEDGCAETCQNRSMLYECDEHNCNIGREFCTNRQFKDLQERTKKGGRYRVGVEVVKTEDRGFGIRANRCFEPYQIIMEYTGEIITNEECENRMNEIYKDNKCYYLMSFDQNMIIDATTGSIARFVNHSCSPNCHMIKWIVSGQPRMALFAGSRPIMTGDELTYDYKFDPFSAKSVQKCLCGSPNCRGVLGPKPKEDLSKKVTIKKEGVKTAVKATVKAGKRKLKELLDGPSDDEDEKKAAKKRKTNNAKAATGIKRSLSSASLKAAKGAAKGAATVIKRSVSTISVNARARLSSGSIGSLKKKAASSPRTIKGTPGKKITATTTIRKSSSTSVLKTYGKQKKMSGSSPASSRKVAAARRSVEFTGSRNSSLTIVASNSDETGAGGNKKQHPLAKSKSTTDLADASATSTPVSTKSGRVVKRKSFDDEDGSRAATPTPGSGSRPRAGIEIARVEAQIRVVQEDE